MLQYQMQGQQQSPLTPATLSSIFKEEVVSLPCSTLNDQTCTLYKVDYESMLPQRWLRTAPIDFLIKIFLDRELREICKIYASRGVINQEEHLQYMKMVDLYVVTMLMTYDDQVVLKSLEGLQLFSQKTKYLVIPVNTENASGSHWLLGCFKNGRFKGAKQKSQLVMFDSAGSGLALGQILKRKLSKLYSLLHYQDLDIELTRCKDVPIQNNNYDCGVYTLAFAEYALKQIVNQLQQGTEQIKWDRLTKEYKYLVGNSSMARQRYRRMLEQRLLESRS